MDNTTEEFRLIRPLYESFRLKIQNLLQEVIKGTGIEIISIESRTKEIESFEGKINRTDKNYQNPLLEITDLCGLRIITYYTEDIYKIANLIESEFIIDIENSIDKTKILSPDKFGYLSLHYVVSLNEKRNTLPEWKEYKNLKCEIQIRTILQHAWAAIEHKINYKTKAEIPSTLKRKIYRLSALLELADEQFLLLKNETSLLSSKIKDSIDEGNLDLEFNSLSVISYLNRSSIVAKILDIAKSVGYLEVSDNYFNNHLDIFLPRLIETLKHSNLKSLEDLNNFLEVNIESIEEKLDKFITIFKTKTISDVSAIKSDILMIILLMSNELEINIKSAPLLKSIDWTHFIETIKEL